MHDSVLHYPVPCVALLAGTGGACSAFLLQWAEFVAVLPPLACLYVFKWRFVLLCVWICWYA